MIDLLVGAAVLSVLLLANDLKCAILRRHPILRWDWLLPRPKVIAECKVGKRTMRVIRLPKGTVRPAAGWFRRGAA